MNLFANSRETRQRGMSGWRRLPGLPALLVALLPSAAVAHETSVPHAHPHGFELATVAVLGVLLLLAGAAACGARILRGRSLVRRAESRRRQSA